MQASKLRFRVTVLPGQLKEIQVFFCNARCVGIGDTFPPFRIHAIDNTRFIGNQKGILMVPVLLVNATNFKTITDRINYFKKLKEDKVAGKLEKYTKKERLDIDKELVKLDRLFGGIETLNKLPAMMFIADLTENQYAALEAKQKGIPVVALLNTDADPKLADHIIPANDRNPKSIELIMNYLEEQANEGKKQALLKKEEDLEKENKTPSNEAEEEKTK